MTGTMQMGRFYEQEPRADVLHRASSRQKRTFSNSTAWIVMHAGQQRTSIDAALVYVGRESVSSWPVDTEVGVGEVLRPAVKDLR